MTYRPYRIEQVGTMTKGGFDYQIEYHFHPRHDDRTEPKPHMVVVYRKDRVHERGLVFTDDAHFRVWGKDALPVQQVLFT